MADLRVIIEVDYGRETAESPGTAGVAATTQVPVTGVLQAHPDGGGGLLGVIPGFIGWEPVRADIEVQPSVATWLDAWANLGDARWFVVDGAMTGWLANMRQPLVASYQNAAGVNVIEPAIQIDGLALPAAGAAATFRGSVAMRRLLSSSFSGQLVLGDFVDDATLPGANPDDLEPYVRVKLGALRFASSPVVLGTTGTGNNVQTRQANQCQATFSDPYGRVWLGPGDLGLGPFQLPPDLGLMNAERLRLFPSIFLRRTPYIRGVRAAASASVNPVNTPESAPRVIVAREVPAFSRWRVWTDTRMWDGWVRHPEGADLRTPLAVWNAVFAADALHRNIANPFPIYRFAPGLARGGWFVQGAVARNQFIEAAEFVGFASADGSPIGDDEPIGPNA